ncbi:hypothetical protein C2E23DRAFT_800622 [Lenzites betulinus]|nr:hypothetical protein C2E23DRAFT_800622 [Lenzites betulinus]
MEAVAHLRSSRVSVNRLPPELLLYIFSLLICGTAKSGDSPSFPNSAKVILVTHVCRTWRNLALGAPDLWSSIVATNPTRTAEFLERSQRALLDIYFPQRLPETFYPWIDYIHDRIRSLVIQSASFTTVMCIAKQLSRERRPHLETLHLTYDSPADELLPPGQSRVISFHGDDDPSQPSPTPSLRSLHLFPTLLSWNSSIYSNLSVLDIDGTKIAAPTEERVLQILQQCPGLAEFRLRVKGDLAGPRISSADGAWDVNLPLLSSFALETVSTVCAESLLSHLILPSCTTFLLKLDDTSHVISSPLPRLIPPSSDRIPALTSLTKNAVLKGISPNEIKLTFYPHPRDLSKPVLTLHLKSPDEAVLPSGILDTVETLEVQSLSYAILEHSVFYRTPVLHSLSFQYYEGGELERILEGLWRPPADPLLYPLAFPCTRLETLEFQHVGFGPALEDCVVDLARARAEKGLPLRCITLRDCGDATPGWRMYGHLRRISSEAERGVNSFTALAERLQAFGVSLRDVE